MKREVEQISYGAVEDKWFLSVGRDGFSSDVACAIGALLDDPFGGVAARGLAMHRREGIVVKVHSDHHSLNVLTGIRLVRYCRVGSFIDAASIVVDLEKIHLIKGYFYLR
ncbi:hypothetical protein Ciccas_009580 [Cichlidogyrus casuarinus]|uniref:Uncharacterized protein n=1 Tax=Cichlidogyrus casuarinus TaxID=1844966 RepID=A0ABD2PWN2_9PLAT